ncbi:neuromedin-U isoform X3 [Betta splendens]|uniref:Neuromedin-U isoform X3 n=1 Tax=Betta splendens TaxID=158456 RepID=A0A9W2XRR8_BETSP|nr:neuromedin-U isoform X3 [Betta splendens]
MRTFQSQSPPEQRGAPRSAMNPSAAGVTLAALLILTIPVCNSGPAEFEQSTKDQKQLLSQIDAVCSSYLSADMKFWASDILGELCVLMLVQKSKELKVQENSKRFLSSTPEENEDSQRAYVPLMLNCRDLQESRAEVTSSIGHEMEEDR